MELRKCKCGGEAELIPHFIKGVANRINYFVRCNKCKCRTRNRKKESGAIEDWNNEFYITYIIHVPNYTIK